MDKTMIIWSPPSATTEEATSDRDEQIWTETVRLGEMGGNTLGFLGAQFDPRCAGVLGYSFSGAFHAWEDEGGHEWRPVVQLGGHADQVNDLCWEERGRYLLSVSSDQTTRAHAKWKRRKGKGLWREVARPQVHGHDLTCAASFKGHRLVSGGEEKVARVFQATSSFLTNLEAITGRSLERGDDSSSRCLVKGASVPSLGLSNKAVVQGQTVTRDDERHVKDQYPDHYFKDEK